jgi:hypothetical protein
MSKFLIRELEMGCRDKEKKSGGESGREKIEAERKKERKKERQTDRERERERMEGKIVNQHRYSSKYLNNIGKNYC